MMPTSGNRLIPAFQSAVVLVIFVAAILHGFLFQLQDDAPLWQKGGGTVRQRDTETTLAAYDRLFIDVAQGRNLELHFRDFDASDFHVGLQMSQFYYRANFALFPRRAFVGRGARLINDAADLSEADRLPSVEVLSALNVAAICTFTLNPTGLSSTVQLLR